MNFIFINNKAMPKKSEVLASIGLATALTINPANADKVNDNKVNEVVCETKKACDKLMDSIQAQIKEIESSADPDFDKLDALQNKLIALENNKQESENEKQEQIRNSQDNKIEELRGALLSKDY